MSEVLNQTKSPITTLKWLTAIVRIKIKLKYYEDVYNLMYSPAAELFEVFFHNIFVFEPPVYPNNHQSCQQDTAKHW